MDLQLIESINNSIALHPTEVGQLFLKYGVSPRSGMDQRVAFYMFVERLRQTDPARLTSFLKDAMTVFSGKRLSYANEDTTATTSTTSTDESKKEEKKKEEKDFAYWADGVLKVAPGVLSILGYGNNGTSYQKSSSRQNTWLLVGAGILVLILVIVLVTVLMRKK